MTNKKTIELTDAELKALEVFRRHYADIAILVENGVFEFKGGRAVIHRDHDGKLRKIDIEVTRFKA